MGKFARIIELPNDEQIVLTKGWDEEDGYTVTIETEVDGIKVKATSGFEHKEKERDSMFESYSDETGANFHNEMRKLLLENEPE